MDSIMVCNTASDSLSIISLENDSVYNIPLLLNKKNNLNSKGPHGIEIYKNKICGCQAILLDSRFIIC